MIFNVLIGAFVVILMAVVLFAVIGAIGRKVASETEAPDPVIADSRDTFDPK